jgi:BASS family bile acid:Na+ symporter
VLVANFVLVPVLGLLIIRTIPLREGFAIGLMLMATAAGAPLLPKLVQVAKGAVAMSVGVMTLLMVVTVLYMPLVLPILLPGVQVSPVGIAQSLVLFLLIPLVLGLAIKARYAGMAEAIQPAMAQIGNAGLMLGFVALLALKGPSLLGTFGSGALLAMALLIAGAFLIGWLLARPDRAVRPVLALGSAQRNLSAALVVAGLNFDDPEVLLMCVIGSVMMLGLLMLAAGEMGKRTIESPDRK